MASQSSSPPNSNDGNPINPALEAVQPVTNNQQDVNTGPTKETSVFVNTEPMREDQVQNAVKFLSHPKVKGSPVMYRRSFLERKGLTKEEIDEAFRRVPDEAPSVSTTPPAVANQVGQVHPTSNIQQAPAQYVQPIAAAPAPAPAPAPASSRLGTLTASRFHWSQALIAIGVLAVSGAGTAIIFKKSIVPRLKTWIRKVVLEDEEEGLEKKTNLKPSPAEEAAAAAKAAAAAASDVARASQEMLTSRTEENRYFGQLVSLLDSQMQEMKSMSNSIKKLEGQSKISGRDDYRVPATSSRPAYANGKAEYDTHSARSLSPPLPAPVEPSTAPPHPKSYMEIMAMVQRGERPPNIREINDLPPYPDQPVSNPRLAPRPKPWEAAQPQLGPTSYPQENSNGLNSHVQDNGSGPVHQPNGDGSMPWWQQKNVRITEVEPNEENKTGFSGVANERPVQRPSWVPPQPPPVAMAEAAAAIRQPKKLPIQKEHSLTDDQFLARSAEVVTDELQKATKISESGGVLDDGGSSNMMIASEIRREEDNYYLEQA